jgi:hypothetical protein
MNLHAVAVRLWEERLAGLICAVVAVIAAILICFHISTSPLGLKPKALQLGVAGTSVLIDGHNSSLGTVHGDSKRFDNLAADYAVLMNSQAVIGPIANAIHVSPNEVGVQVQITSRVPLSQSQPLEPQVGTEILATRRRYYVVARVQSGTQILQLYAQAPSGAKALTMVKAAVASLNSLVLTSARSAHTPRAQRIVIRPLGHYYGRTLNRHVSEEAAVLIVVVGWILAMIAVVTFRGQARLARPKRTVAQPTQV